jgi:hypothetical protein
MCHDRNTAISATEENSRPERTSRIVAKLNLCRVGFRNSGFALAWPSGSLPLGLKPTGQITQQDLFEPKGKSRQLAP